MRHSGTEAGGKRVAIVGGGVSGLIAAHRMREAGLQVQVFERRDTVGGLWLYEEEVDKGVMYESLRTNIPKDVMGLADMPMSNTLPSFVSHKDALAFIQEYARRTDSAAVTRFGTEVTQVTPVEPASEHTRWRVCSKATERPEGDQGEEAEEEFDLCLVANGHYNVPHMPVVPHMDQFPGHVSHSAQYRRPQAFRDKRVVIVGDGPSALDLAAEIATAAQHVFVAMRRSDDYRFLETMGSNVSGCSPLVEYDTSQSAFQLRDGDALPGLDAVVYCTGYRYKFPFFDDDIVPTVSNYVACLHEQLFHVDWPSLAFMSIPLRIDPWPVADIQARALASVWTGRNEQSLPNRAVRRAAVADAMKDATERGEPLHRLHLLSKKQWQYLFRLMCLQFGDDWRTTLPFEATRLATLETIYAEVSSSRYERYTSYRDRFYFVPPHQLYHDGAVPAPPAEESTPGPLSAAGTDVFTSCPVCEGTLPGYRREPSLPSDTSSTFFAQAPPFHFHEPL